jgi:hypothetical protein
VHCDVLLASSAGSPRWSRLARALARATVAGGALVTLMACYGMIARPEGPYTSCGGDVDRDGVCVETDCDDTRADVFPGAADPDLDGVDQNCDGVDGWRDPATVATPVAGDEATPIATDPPADPPPEPGPVMATDPPPAPPVTPP